MSEVWAAPPVGGSQLLVLLALADNADDDRRYAWPSVTTLARKTRLSERSVQRALRDLEDAQIIATVKPGGRTEEGNRATVYRVEEVGRQIDTPPVGGDTHDTPGVTSVTPQPSVEPSVSLSSHPSADESDLLLDASVVASARPENDGAAQRHLFPVPDPAPGPPAKREPEKVGRRKVTDTEHDLAEAIITSFNDIAGTKLTAAAWKTAIIGRIREHPEMTWAQHFDVIRAFFDNPKPWWDAPAPNLIYGNAAAFERALIPRTIRKTETEETTDMLRRMHEQARTGEAW